MAVEFLRASDTAGGGGVQIPAFALLAALQGAGRAVVIFDARLRLIHATAEVYGAVGSDGGSVQASSDVRELLAKSQLDAGSIRSATEALEHLLASGRTPSRTLVRRDTGKTLRVDARELGGGLYAAYLGEGVAGEGADGDGAPDHDHVTGLALRRRLERELNGRLQVPEPGRVCLLLMDLDRFKHVNDTLGHAVGDGLLRRVGERLRRATRKDDLVARFGGDEFAILMGQTCTREEAVVIGDRIQDLIQRSFLIDGQPVNVGVSIGIAFAPEHGTEAATLLRNADLAMYEAKRQGRGRSCCFEPAMLDHAMARSANERDLRQALPARQFELHYQPQVCAEGQLCGYEALIRWQHPERGLIPPGDFLPIAEEIGLMEAIGDWVLRTACREAARWPGELLLAVNASPSQLEKGSFVDYVRNALRQSGLPGNRLEIEITEGALLSQSAVVMETLQTLRGMGVRIAIDDFGTGYASLSQLANFPFDRIKLDRSLVGFDGDDVKKRAIVRAVTSLGRSLGMNVLGEGVETAEQLERLRVDGCVAMQGYYLGRPAPSTEIGMRRDDE